MLESQLAARMEQLQATVQSKTAVPTAQVYVSRLAISILEMKLYTKISTGIQIL